MKKKKMFCTWENCLKKARFVHVCLEFGNDFLCRKHLQKARKRQTSSDRYYVIAKIRRVE